LQSVADDTEAGQLLDELPRELGAFPVVVDDRKYVGVDELPGSFR
jgi:hypothetical protein